MMKIDRKK